MSTKALQVARFTAQQVADAVSRTYGHPLVVEVNEVGGSLFYVVARSDSTRRSLPLACASTTLADLMAIGGSIFYGLYAL